MKIYLASAYNHVSGVSLEAGEYDVNDPRLKGLANYLIQNDRVTITEEDEPEPPAAEKTVETLTPKRKGVTNGK